MKKNYLFIFLFSISICALNAQVMTMGPNPAIVKILPTSGKNPAVMVIDTLVPPSFGAPYMCDSAFRCYDFDYALPIDSGYVFGNSKYNGTEAAQKYYWSGNVSELLVVYGKKAGTTGATYAKIYSVDPSTKKPLASLGSSTTVLTGAIVANFYTKYTFAPPVTVTNVFAGAVVFPPNGPDTVGLASTKVYCSSGDTLSFIKFPSAGGWRTCPGAYSVPYDPTANLDLLIYPVIDGPTGTNDFPSSNGLTMLGVYPNPASAITAIGFETAGPETVSVEVFDLSGKVLYSATENVNGGKGHMNVDISEFAAGNYYYTISTNSAKMTSKFSVVK